MAKDDAQKRFQKSFKSYMKSGGDQGGKRIFAGFSALDGPRGGGGGGGKKPKPEDPPLPPTDGGDGDEKPVAAVPKTWPAIVDHFFPYGGTGYKAGGLVRGGGAAVKGRGRGRIV